MVNIKELRFGCHVLVGGNYDTFSVPKHYAKVVGIGDGYILSKSTEDQEEPDRYKVSDVDGIVLADIIPILEKNGFKQSKLCEDRYYKVSSKAPDYRIEINISPSAFCSSIGVSLVERYGCRYLHELEAIIADSRVDFEFML